MELVERLLQMDGELKEAAPERDPEYQALVEPRLPERGVQLTVALPQPPEKAVL